MHAPVRSDNRARLMQAAAEAFLADGYRTSVDDIARRAGVVKQTLYHHFKSKDRLFEEVARELAKGILISLPGEPAGLRGDLVRFGTLLRRHVLGREGLGLFRTLSAEMPRFRVLARAIYAGSAGETRRRLAEFLARAMDRGLLRRDDAEFAADMLLGMLAGQDRMRRLFGVEPALSGKGEDVRTGKIIDCFLRAFDPARPSDGERCHG